MREGHELADSLLPGDIKGLTKQQLKDLKAGKGSPKHLLKKYADRQYLTQIKSKHAKKHTVVDSVESSQSFGATLETRSVKESTNSPPNKSTPRDGRIRNTSIIDSSPTKSPSLSHVLRYVNSLKVGKAKSYGVDCIKSTVDEKLELSTFLVGGCRNF